MTLVGWYGPIRFICICCLVIHSNFMVKRMKTWCHSTTIYIINYLNNVLISVKDHSFNALSPDCNLTPSPECFTLEGEFLLLSSSSDSSPAPVRRLKCYYVRRISPSDMLTCHIQTESLSLSLSLSLAPSLWLSPPMVHLWLLPWRW